MTDLKVLSLMRRPILGKNGESDCLMSMISMSGSLGTLHEGVSFREISEVKPVFLLEEDGLG